MEWVETTGPTVDAAKDAALDQLGVDEEDAEFEVIEEPKTGLFGRLRSEARVRARVRPATPRPKEDRRERRQRRPEGPARGGRRPTAGETSGRSTAPPSQEATEGQRQRGSGGRPRPERSRAGSQNTDQGEKEAGMSDGGSGMDVSLEQQGEVAEDFLVGLVQAFGLQANIRVNELDEDTLELNLDGEELTVLIGARGATLQAIQDLTRTVVQRQTGAAHGRLMVDVLGYRKKRREALERFASEQAETVRSSGERLALEPMGAADRKVVHDVINSLDGVSTTSEGEEPRRRVVILPAE